jgi:EmrB/QacA subfamily drug resistance transporter
MQQTMVLPRRNVVAITAGVMLSLFLASMESTVVATAMPTIVAQLGGLGAYSWVFSAYMLASTTTVPLFGKLSDIYGRRPVYLAALALFVVGSLLCGIATTMGQLIAFRVVQGLGAGGLLPLAFIMMGDIFTLEQRARVQGLFSGVWGVSSVLGPLLGGFLVDRVAWNWVFLINIFPALLAGLLVGTAWVDHERALARDRPPIDYAGAALLALGATALLLGLFELGSLQSLGLLALAALLLGALFVVERRAADPVLPLPMFRDRVFAVACANALLAGAALFGSTTFVPLYAQAVLGTSATAAGATLTPLLIGWVFAAIVGTRLLLRVGFRTLATLGMALLTLGSAGLLLASATSASYLVLALSLALMGIGMGLSVPALLLAVQNSVPRRSLGIATSSVQFSRSLGGAIGISVMGAILSIVLAARLRAAGLDPQGVSVEGLLDPLGAGAGAIDAAVLRAALAGALTQVFLATLVLAVVALVVTALAPGGLIADLDVREP